MTGSNVCQNCGQPVSDNFRRVFGDNDDEAHACYECESYAAISDGAASGRQPTAVEIDAGGGADEFSWARNTDH